MYAPLFTLIAPCSHKNFLRQCHGFICFTTQISPQHCPALLQTGKEAMVLLTIQYDYPDPVLKRPMDRITCKTIGVWLDPLTDCFAALPHSVSHVLLCTLLPSLVMHLALSQNFYASLSCGIYQLSELLKNIHIDDMPMAWLQATGNWLQIACIQLPVTWFWWSQAGSNRRPPACKAGALPAELWPPDFQ